MRGLVITVGKLVVFEGIDGSGKSTQFDLLCARYTAENRDFMRLRFPRYDNPSSALIRMYLGGEFGEAPDAVNAYAASSFFAVDRIASFLQEWRDYYESGGLVLTDRYSTSNAIHQGAKLDARRREHFFKWLYDYEFCLLGLPAPDVVLYMDIDADRAARRLARRQAEAGTTGDIHERDTEYLECCSQSGRQAAEQFGWRSVKCFEGELERSEDDVHREIYTILKHE